MPRCRCLQSMTTREHDSIENFATGMASRCRRSAVSDFRNRLIDEQCRSDFTWFRANGLSGADHDYRAPTLGRLTIRLLGGTEVGLDARRPWIRFADDRRYTRIALRHTCERD